jgi:hypothetical protein
MAEAVSRREAVVFVRSEALTGTRNGGRSDLGTTRGRHILAIRDGSRAGQMRAGRSCRWKYVHSKSH